MPAPSLSRWHRLRPRLARTRRHGRRPPIRARILPPLALGCLLVLLGGGAAWPGPPEAPDHGRLDVLLKRYVSDAGVDYGKWATNEADFVALSDYVKHLERIRVSELEKTPNGRDEALAYWINLYNAATLELVLTDYPIDSIKDLGSLFSSPWERDLVTVEGKKLTLDRIENEIIRPKFGDARIHFALNCAARSCPPLRAGAYFGDRIDEQLEEQTRAFLGNPEFNRIEGGHYRLSRIFDWYRDDFEKAAGSVAAFVRSYMEGGAAKVPEDRAKVSHLDYDWKLNDSSS